MAIISVIIPCYNVESYIDRCLKSVISQHVGRTALEIICVDDASTDGTWEKLQAWERSFPEQIILVHCEQNGRQGTARNVGLHYSTCDLVAFLDADDWIEPDYLEKMFRIYRKHDCDLVVCRMERDYSHELTLFQDRSTGKESHHVIIDSKEKRNYFVIFNSMENSACARLIRKSLLMDNQLFFPEYLAYEDTFWGSLLHLYTSKVYFLEEKLYHYYVNPDSTVLAANLDYHPDLLTVQNFLWREWERRGFLNQYREALEYDYLHSCYFSFIKILAFRYDRPSYSLFLLLKEMVSDKLNRLEDNQFIKEAAFPELYRLLLESLTANLTKADFQKLIENVRAIGL